MGDDDLVTVVEGQQTAEGHQKDHSAKYQVSVSFCFIRFQFVQRLFRRLAGGITNYL